MASGVELKGADMHRAVLRRNPFGWTTIAWAKIPLLRNVVPKLLPVKKPPILVLSLPRSGSSWLGSILGVHPDLLYYREPITDFYQRIRGARDAVPYLPSPKNDTDARLMCKMIVGGVPVFRDEVIGSTATENWRQRWQLRSRRRKRVVVKEVNTSALRWLEFLNSPFVIYLRRHPAGVALSRKQLGWVTKRSLRTELGPTIFVEDLSESDLEWYEREENYWKCFGFYYAAVEGWVEKFLKGNERSYFVSYENLVRYPIDESRRIFAACGLGWAPEVEEHLRRTTQSSRSEDPFSVSRNSGAMAEAWRKGVGNDEVRMLREGMSRVSDLADRFEW